MRASEGFWSTTAVNFFAVGFGAVNGLLLARVLDPVGRGELARAAQPLSLIGVGALLGHDELTVLRVRSRIHTVADERRMVLLAAVSGVFALSVFYFLGVSHALAPLVLLPVTTAVGSLQAGKLRGVGAFKSWNSMRLAAAAGTPASLVVLLAIQDQPLLAASVSALVGSFVAALVGLLVARSTARNNSSVAGFFAGIPHLAVKLQSSLVARGDLLVLAVFGSLSGAGLYAVALSAAAPVTAVSHAVGTQSFSDSSPGLEIRWLGVVVASVSSLVVVLVAPTVLPLLAGEVYRAAVRPAQILALAAVAAAVRLAVIGALRRAELALVAARLETVVLLLQLLGAFTAVRVGGAVAVATSVLSVGVVGAVAAFFVWHRYQSKAMSS